MAADEEFVTWARAGGRSGSYRGAVYTRGELTWACTCRHATRDAAVECARQRQPVPLAQCITELTAELEQKKGTPL